MKKLFVIFIFSSLSALYQGNPTLCEMPEEGIFLSPDCPIGFKFGGRFDYVLKKELVLDNLSPVNPKLSNAFSYQSYVSTITMNIIDRVEMYFSLGSMDANFLYRPNPGTYVDFDLGNHFMWIGGGRVILLFWNDSVMGVDAKYMSSSPPCEAILQNGIPRDAGGSFHYNEWQIGITLSYTIKSLIPYIGFAYSSSSASLHGVPNNKSTDAPILSEVFQTKGHAALVAGTSVSKDKILDVNMELRTIGEKAFATSVNLRF